MKVLLVQPPTHGSLGLQAFMLPEPLGLEMIGASLWREHEVLILDMRLEPSLRQKLASFKPDAVGVSACFTSDVYNVYRVLEIIREHNRYILTFVGGHHASMTHADFVGKVDAVVLGEGELTAPELIRCWEKKEPLDTVKGLAFSSGNKWIQNASQSLIQDLDKIPLPARYLVSKYRQHYFITSRRPIALVETSRGCPYKCKFCSVWRLFRQSFRCRSPQKVVEDLKRIESRDILFTDDSAFSNGAQFEGIANDIAKAGLHKRYSMQIRADSVVKNCNSLNEWKNIGLESVFIGFESITQPRLDEYGKRLTVNYLEEAINILRSLDIMFMPSFIVSPDFSREDFDALRGFIRRTKFRMPTFSILTPLPGTLLCDERAQETTSHNYELYDLLHATLPTKLELREFYNQFIRLYISAYKGYFSPKALIKPLRQRQLGSFFTQASQALRLLMDYNPRALVNHHRLPPGGLSEKRFPKLAGRLNTGGTRTTKIMSNIVNGLLHIRQHKLP